MNRYLLKGCIISALISFSSCEDERKFTAVEYDPNKEVKLTSFFPTEGGARDKILLDGENFGQDPSKIKVYFNKARATVVSSSGNRIYA
ncbi:MAG TPA: IPT/TIG domain-containing protein, partial [Sphingobacterium bovisgrunnientis]|nr:IPT/TIG domain-containing protein [Sphingobacterium bovisgrunnientis]